MKIHTAIVAIVAALFTALALAQDEQSACEVAVHSKDAFAYQLCLPVAEQGDAQAQYRLGWMYFDGYFGAPRDRKQTAHWWRESAEQGHADAQYWLGLRGRHLGPKASEQAEHWLRKAAEQGHAKAQYELGSRSKDDDEEYNWYLKAAKQGDAQAQYRLGWMHFIRYIQVGKRVLAGARLSENLRNQGEKDYKMAHRWYRAAAEQGHVDAQYRLGGLHDTARDYIEAYKWYSLAADKYYDGPVSAIRRWLFSPSTNEVGAGRLANLTKENAEEKLDLLEPAMSSRQVAEARKRIIEWRRAHQKAADQ